MNHLDDNVRIFSIAEFAKKFPKKVNEIFLQKKVGGNECVIIVAKNIKNEKPIHLLNQDLETITIIVEDYATASFIVDDNPTKLHITVIVGKNSKLYLFPIIKKSIELSIEMNLQQQGAQGYIAGYYVLENDQQAIMKTMQMHNAQHTKSNLAINGILSDTAQAMYEGTICIEHNAAYSDAAQSNKNMLFGQRARAISVPNLEVKTNEVQCKHGSAVGQLDLEQLFYLQSRGLSMQCAKQILIESFIVEVFKEIPKEIVKFLPKKLNLAK